MSAGIYLELKKLNGHLSNIAESLEKLTNPVRVVETGPNGVVELREPWYQMKAAENAKQQFKQEYPVEIDEPHKCEHGIPTNASPKNAYPICYHGK